MHFYKKIDTQCTDNMDIEKTIVARMDETIGSAVETKLKADSFSMSETSCGEDSLDKVKKGPRGIVRGGQMPLPNQRQ